MTTVVKSETRGESPRGQVLDASISKVLDIEAKLESTMKELRDVIDSPKSLLIAKNAVLTLLEVEGSADFQTIFLLVKDKKYREGIVDKLESETPNYWDQKWNEAWSKEIEPLYSVAQQVIVRRRSLINFWTKEWNTLPEDEVRRIVTDLSTLI